MSVAQSGSDFGGDLVQRQSDDTRCASGSVGSTICGIGRSSLGVEVFIGRESSRSSNLSSAVRVCSTGAFGPVWVRFSSVNAIVAVS